MVDQKTSLLRPIFFLMVAMKSGRMLPLLDDSCNVQIIFVSSVLSCQELLEDYRKVHYLLNFQTMKHSQKLFSSYSQKPGVSSIYALV